MSVNKTIFVVTAGLIILAGVIFFAFERKTQEVGRHYTSDLQIEQTWELPQVLEEVSGIAYLDNDRLACIQDEKGTIFIYDLNSAKIEEEIAFAGAGDYEGISVSGDTIFVLKSDGTIYRVADFKGTRKVTVHETSLTGAQDVEGLCYDPQNQRLLLAIKEKEPETSAHKGIYAIDPQTMQMQEEPVFRLLFRDPVFDEVKEKRGHNTFRPSEINIHPVSGKIYMLEGETPKLLILSEEGEPERLRFLNTSDFPKPEGITFSEDGQIYISNEGEPATIHRINLEN